MDRSVPSPSSTLVSAEDTPSIGYLCPLYTELAAVIATFDEYLGQQVVGEDGDEYYYGRIGNRMAVGVNFEYGEMGPITAAEYASRLIITHPSLRHPRSMCLLVGIAGGLWSPEHDIRLGDVVIGTRIWDWRAGKQTSHGLETTSFPKDVSRILKRRLPSFIYDKDALARSITQRVEAMREKDPRKGVRWTYQGQANDRLYLDHYLTASSSSELTSDDSNVVARPIRMNEYPKVHSGLIASGNVVLKDAVNRKSLLEKQVYAVEMEACGVPNDFISVRGISDYADSHKNDNWQPYAAAVAAACARLLVDHFVASADQDAMYVHRINSDPGQVPMSEPSWTMSTNSLATNERNTESSFGSLPLRTTQSHQVLPTVGNDPRSTNEDQENRPPPPLPPRRGSRPVETIQPSSGAIPADSVSPTDRPSMVSTKEEDTNLESGHVVLTQYGTALYTGIWKRATRNYADHSKEPPVSWGEKSWDMPRVTLYLQKADPAYTSQCFLIFTASTDVDGGLHDRLWLPLNALRFGLVEGQMQIVYETFLNKDEPLTSPTWLLSGDVVRMQLLLEPQDGNISNPKSLVAQLSVATMALLPNPITVNPASVLSAEIGHGSVQVDGGNVKNTLFVHQVDSKDMHYCVFVAFTAKLVFRLNVLPDHIELVLKEMSSLNYDMVKPLVIGLQSDEVVPSIKVDWIKMLSTYTIRTPPRSGVEVLNNTISTAGGWKAINVTRGMQIAQMTDRGAMPFGGAFLGKTLAKAWTKLADQWSTYLFTWQKDDMLRFLITTNMRFESDDKTADATYDGWTIKAGRRELFKQTSSSGRYKITFELDQRSREGSYISLANDSMFDLPETHRVSCSDSITLVFPNAETYEKFHTSVEDRFWRK